MGCELGGGKGSLTRPPDEGDEYRPIPTLPIHRKNPMTDTTLSPASAMGTFDQSGNYVPRKITERDASFAEEFANTFRDIKEGKLVTGTVVRITREEVLVEIGFKTEGVILARELTIRQDVDPATVVKLGESIEALVLTLEDKEGRLLLSKKRAQYERAWGEVERVKNEDGVVEGLVIEEVKAASSSTSACAVSCRHRSSSCAA